MKRVTDPADPQRCKFAFAHEQCWYVAENGDHCEVHNGGKPKDVQEKRLYRLAEVESRVRLSELADHPGVKNLKEEVGLLRMMIEHKINSAKTESERLANYPSLNTMIMSAARLVKDCHELEQNLGELLSKHAVVRLGQELVNIIIDELKDVEGHEEIIDRILERFLPAIENAQNAEQL